MSVNKNSTTSSKMGEYLSQQLTSLIIGSSSSMAAKTLANYALNAYNLPADINNPEQAANTEGYQPADLATKGLSIIIGMIMHGLGKDYIANTIDYLLNPIFGHKQSDLGEMSDFAKKQQHFEFVSPDFVKEDSVIDLIGEGAEFVPAY